MIEGKGVTKKANTSSSELPENCIKVSLEKTPAFYANIGRRLLSTGVSSSLKNVYDEVIIAGLGVTTKTAIATASIMEKQKIGKITKIQTEYYSSDKSSRKTPKISIVVKKITEESINDEVNNDIGQKHAFVKDVDGEINPEIVHM